MGSGQSSEPGTPSSTGSTKKVSVSPKSPSNASQAPVSPLLIKRAPTAKQVFVGPNRQESLSSPVYLKKAEELSALNWQKVLNQASKECDPYKGKGKVADYIPALASVDINHFGAALALTNGQVFTVGDADVPFSIQSISKSAMFVLQVFSLALAYKAVGDELWKIVGREPSGNAFNSIVQLESEKGIPRNPFINAGAIVVTDCLHSITAAKGGACVAIEELLRTESGNPAIRVDEVVANSEASTGHRNRAMAEFMHSFGNMRCSIDQSLNQYFRQCSIAISCRDLALAGRYLAHRTASPADKENAQEAEKANKAQQSPNYIPTKNNKLTTAEAKRLLAIMMTCGTYDGSGEVAFRIGLPAKSGVGGGILAVIPDVGALVVWSPGLDERGNSLAGLHFLDAVTQLSNCSIF